MIKLLFPICTLTWSVNNYVSCQGKGINKKNVNINFGNNIVGTAERYSYFVIQLTVIWLESIPQLKGRSLLFCTLGFILKEKKFSLDRC